MAEQRTPPSEFFDQATAPQASQEVERWRRNPLYVPPFRVIRWRVVDEEWEGRTAIDAVVVVEIEGHQDFGCAQGVGGVNALDMALQRVLSKHFPFLEGVRVMESYTHRGGEGTAAEVVSVQKFSDGRHQWSTMRKSRDLLASAWLALVDGYEWIITNGLQKKP
ncbi:MAG: alpha-isopropylmalate synthase regulatory domain-containing protein [Candidatus Binatia bacterium]